LREMGINPEEIWNFERPPAVSTFRFIQPAKASFFCVDAVSTACYLNHL
jgi:hypothetical protein